MIRMRNKESTQQKKQSYSDELKSEAVKMVNEQGLSQDEVGRRLSIAKGTIANWVAAVKSGIGRSRPGDPSVAELAAENQRLRNYWYRKTGSLSRNDPRCWQRCG
jgi:transposase